jgi:hypothetical protein
MQNWKIIGWECWPYHLRPTKLVVFNAHSIGHDFSAVVGLLFLRTAFVVPAGFVNRLFFSGGAIDPGTGLIALPQPLLRFSSLNNAQVSLCIPRHSHLESIILCVIEKPSRYDH